jgi:hypothetical protein
MSPLNQMLNVSITSVFFVLFCWWHFYLVRASHQR